MRLRGLAHDAGARKSLLAAAIAVALISALTGAIWLFAAPPPVSGGTPVSELRMRLACTACPYRALITIHDLRKLEAGSDGLVRCPGCGAMKAERFRPGTPPPIQVHPDAPANTRRPQ